ncbi:sensor histidine kinase [Methylocucumis oryzae]|uniref:sensor histidine kinase n=1 Tax=Methylocucumis oryzae TaxID=1632867 RepID=UPI0006989C82|nr:histidine kinase dimerization/phospho-acceptor domain-containing protein [Methylocucumis oryzae]
MLKTGAVHWDEQMFSIYGVSPTAEGQVTYQDWRNAVLAHEIEQQEEIINEMLLTKKNRECRQFSIQRHNDGGIRVIESVDNLRLDNSGEPEWIVGTNWDITERKRAEQQTLKLLNELKRSNAELNSFTYIASHDLKSPLRGIDQLATWITEDLGDNLDTDTQTHLKLMRSRINRMEMLLDDLLTYSRVGRIDQAPEMVDVRELIENIFDLTAHSSTMQLRLADDLPIFITEKSTARTSVSQSY